MQWIQWLQQLGVDANPAKAGFQAQWLYVGVCVAMPVTIGLFVGFALRLFERATGIQLGKGGGH